MYVNKGQAETVEEGSECRIHDVYTNINTNMRKKDHILQLEDTNTHTHFKCDLVFR